MAPPLITIDPNIENILSSRTHGLCKKTTLCIYMYKYGKKIVRLMQNVFLHFIIFATYSKAEFRRRYALCTNSSKFSPRYPVSHGTSENLDNEVSLLLVTITNAHTGRFQVRRVLEKSFLHNSQHMNVFICSFIDCSF